MLTSFMFEHTYTKPVTLILSGQRPPYELSATFPLHHAALDGRISDLGVYTNPNVMPEDQRQKLTEMVGTADGKSCASGIHRMGTHPSAGRSRTRC